MKNRCNQCLALGKTISMWRERFRKCDVERRNLQRDVERLEAEVRDLDIRLDYERSQDASSG